MKSKYVICQLLKMSWCHVVSDWGCHWSVQILNGQDHESERVSILCEHATSIENALWTHKTIDKSPIRQKGQAHNKDTSGWNPWSLEVVTRYDHPPECHVSKHSVEGA